MKKPRGLFGSAARDTAYPVPVENTNPERSYLGGLVKYQRPMGQTGADRMALFGSTLSDVGAALDGRQGSGVAEMQREMLGRQAATQEAERRAAFAATLDPSQAAFFKMAPEAFLAARAKAYEPQKVSGGETILNGLDGGPYTAPKLVEDGGVYGTQGPDGYTQTGQRGATIAETETARSNREDEATQRIRTAVAQGQLSVQQGQLALDQLKHSARAAAGGYGTPGAAPTWEEF